MNRKFNDFNTNLERHTCQAWDEGDWVYFHCPNCGFKRKLNWKTGKTVLINPGNIEALHSGMNIPFQLQEAIGGEN